MIRGFALHDEIETYESLGMPTAEALRTATVNASIALGDRKSFGSIEVGKRADLLLLERNPLQTAKNFAKHERGHGAWHLARPRHASVDQRQHAIDLHASCRRSLSGPPVAEPDCVAHHGDVLPRRRRLGLQRPDVAGAGFDASLNWASRRRRERIATFWALVKLPTDDTVLDWQYHPQQWRR